MGWDKQECHGTSLIRKRRQKLTQLRSVAHVIKRMEDERRTVTCYWYGQSCDHTSIQSATQCVWHTVCSRDIDLPFQRHPSSQSLIKCTTTIPSSMCVSS